MKNSLWVLFLMAMVSVTNFAKAAAPIESGLEPETEEKSNVFQDLGVVQRKAMKKRGKFLLSSYFSLEFSDGPYTNYSFHINPGYAINDFWEVYISFAPAYMVAA